MRLGTSLRFLYPTGVHTHALFKQALAAAAARAGGTRRSAVRRQPRGARGLRELVRADSGTRAVDGGLAEGYRGTGMDDLLVGSARTVVEKLHQYRALGFEYVMVRRVMGDHRQMLRSFERIGEAVMPAI